ncbi:serine phosphatase RsbU, regulator of sigma subunit [Candidatus Magnetoovum chiemensis]|nr:serine phosphatase RsbU, regulator of sigma subunit [Candidatus Magnetoovum chiemensis]
MEILSKSEEDFFECTEKRVNDLKALIEVSALITSTLDFQDLIPLVMEKAKEIMHADACSILFYNKTSQLLEFEYVYNADKQIIEKLKDNIKVKIGEGIAGIVAQNQRSELVADADSDERLLAEADKLTGFKTKSLIAVPLISRRGFFVGVAEIINPKDRRQFNEYDVELFQALCSFITVAIENTRIHKESLESQRIRRELDIASEIQKSFLPNPSNFHQGSIEITAINAPAEKIGGDFYDFISLDDENVGVIIGDVSGKGITAALYMAKILSDFRYLALSENKTSSSTLKRLNNALINGPRGMFLSASYLCINTKTGASEISVAGHPPFIAIEGDKIAIVQAQAGAPIGILENMEYPATALKYKTGDRVIMLTDGVYDAKNKNGERIGFEQVIEFIKQHKNEPVIIEKIVEHITLLSNGTKRADDLTLVEIKWL